MSAARIRLSLTSAVIAGALIVGSPAGIAAKSDASAARVIWVRGDRVYIAAPDSATLDPGQHVDLLDHGRAIAGAEVERRLDAAIVVTRVTSGSLDRVKHVDRLDVRVAPAIAPAPPARLRVGIPNARANPLFRCEPGTAGMHARYRRLEGAAERWVRGADGTKASPETLTLARFIEAADEEIALERGEIDIAVFWPGELSSHMRNDPRWRDALSGSRSGVIAAIAAPASAEPPLLPDSLRIAALNRQVFHSDLAMIRRPPPGDSAGVVPAAVRWVFDPSMPGHAALDRAIGTSEASGGSVVRLGFVDAAAGGLDPSAGVVPLLAMRCPVVCAPHVRDWAATVGGDWFATFTECARAAPPGGRP
ncbi:MAG: hypothetical protein HYR74_05110 [Candidatus Eisenbacteria bacterium]|nr:hypothetical protein [Candidatus Eisenbacteria bacterium]